MYGYKAIQTRDTENRFVKALGTRLSNKIEPACILAQGDSTGNGTNEWVYLMSQYLAQKLPNHTTTYRLWNDAVQGYDAPIIMQTGSSGDAYALMTGVAGSFISTSDKSILQITGDLDVACKVLLDNWTSVAAPILISKFGAAGNRGWALYLNGGAVPYLWWSEDGTNQYTKNPGIALPFVDGQPLWIRFKFDVNNGQSGNTITFYTSSDGVNWIQLGVPIVTPGITSIFASTAPLEFGSRTNGMDTWSGKVYEAIVRNGINGNIVASPNLDLAFPIGSVSFKDVEGNVWTKNGSVVLGNGSPGILILNASHPGAAIAYSTDETRFALQTPIEPQLAFINYGHNQGSNVDIQSTYEGLCTQLITKYPNTGVVCIAQNPQRAPEVNITPHAIRCRQISMLSAKNNYGLVDVYRKFIETGNIDNYMLDGCHPNPAGSNLWRDEVIKFLQVAVM